MDIRLSHVRSALLAAALAAFPGVSCGGASGPGPVETATFPATAFQTELSADGAIALEVRTSPQPPSRGSLTVEYRMTDRHGSPLDGLTLEVTPWMPAMGHGSSTVPAVEAKGGGVYLLSQVNLFMPGLWELRTHATGAETGDVTPSFQIP